VERWSSCKGRRSMPRTEIPDIRHTVADGCGVAAVFVRETD
jgi:hypothetical protein